ncbi:MAG: transposase [Candidatus Caenarcaniphilales bacterium]|nr:transposase [Candidatus Caenarcaniphilales bacterium]
MSKKTEYSKEFKEEAIRLCKVKVANKAEIARKLGLTYKTLCNWFYDSNDEISPEEKAEIKRLNKENARLAERGWRESFEKESGKNHEG